MGCAPSLAISKVPDARRQGVTSEAYNPYSAGRNDHRQPSRRCRMVDQGWVLMGAAINRRCAFVIQLRLPHIIVFPMLHCLIYHFVQDFIKTANRYAWSVVLVSSGFTAPLLNFLNSAVNMINIQIMITRSIRNDPQYTQCTPKKRGRINMTGT